MALAESVAINRYVMILTETKNPLQSEVEGYLSAIEQNLKQGRYNPEVSGCIADANLRYAYVSGIIPMNRADNAELLRFRDDLRKIVLEGTTCEEIHSIVDGIEQKVYH
jgi:hypothetical protein